LKFIFALTQVKLWDTAGLERFQSPMYTHYSRAHGALLVYSVADPYTFDNLQVWVTEAKRFVETNPFKWALIGNKCDLPSEVDSTRVEARCVQLQTKISYDVSAKTGCNVMRAFNDLIATIHRDNHDNRHGFAEHSILLANTPPESKSRCSCRLL